MSRFGFPKAKRLVTNDQFKAVLDHKLFCRNDLLTLYASQNELGYSRLGVSVGKSCGDAVARNRIKRLVREAFRQSVEQLSGGFDYVVMVSPDWLQKFQTPKDIKRAVKELAFEQVRDSFLALAALAVKKSAGK